MSLSSVFQVLQLAVGPSLPYTTGALKIGQYFREVLIGVPFHKDNRLLVEMLGDFAHYGKDHNSDVAVVAGLSGYISGETRMSIRKLFSIIHKEGGFQLLSNTWPFNDESDIIFNRKSTDFSHPNTIRFHVISDEGKVLLQAEYTVSSKGIVSGPGSRDSDPGSNIDQVDSLEEVLSICKKEKIGILDYIYSSEELIHSVSAAQTLQRMINTWNIIESGIENGLTNSGKIHPDMSRKAQQIFTEYKKRMPLSDLISKENATVSIYACSVCEENLANQMVITAPVCETAGILSAVLKTLQTRYLCNPVKMAEALLVAGFIGSLLSKSVSQISDKTKKRHDFTIATAMAAAGGIFLLGENEEMIHRVIRIVMEFTDTEPDYSTSNLIKHNIRYANIALECINLALIGYPVSSLPIEKILLQKIRQPKS